MTNAFTVDFEDWYQGIELPFTEWHKYERRIEKGFYNVFELLQKHNVKATFFTLGWVAKEYPHLVKELAEAGHELASHGYSHEKVYNLTPQQFRKEITDTKKIIEDISSQPVVAYRAPFFSITEKSLWALKILAEEGHTIDCSISPIKTWRYGIANCPDEIFNISEANIIEFPVSAFKRFTKRWAIGGAYFRLFPYNFTSSGIRKRSHDGAYNMFYIHPWEYDPEHPKVKMERKAQFTHYTHLSKTIPNTEKLLSHFKFDTVSNVVKKYKQQHGIRDISINVLQS